jgi:hypothetical protein
MRAKELRSFFSRACSALLPVADQERETSRPCEYVALEREVNCVLHGDTTVPLCVGSFEDYCKAVGVDPRMVRR